MSNRTLLIGLVAALCLPWSTPAWAAAPPAASGRLLIVGGALAPDNADVHRAFIAAAGGAETARIAIIPAASGEPSGSAGRFADSLVSYGVSADRIAVLAVAVEDDPATEDVDEAAWSGGGEDPAEIAKLAAATGVWMTGGDQARLTAVLLRPDGADTAMLAALRARLAAGAVLGGTSAGAAVMSRTMIARGDSVFALAAPARRDGLDDSRMDGGPLVLTAGLGFLPIGVVDQHFDRKARLPRLIRALETEPAPERLGLGIDEDTAALVTLDDLRVEAIGRGTVTLLDLRRARFGPSGGRLAVEDGRLSVLAAGDRATLTDGAVVSARWRAPTRGDEYYDHAPAGGAGLAVPNGRLDQALGVDLLDNAAATTLERVTFGGDGRGARFVFSEVDRSQGYWGRDPEGREAYGLSGVRFDVRPVDVQLRNPEETP